MEKFKLKEKLSELTLAKPGEQDLRSFGIILGLLIIVFFYLLFPFLLQYKPPFWPLYTTIILIFLSGISPKRLEVLYQIWMIIGNILAYINTRIILGFIFLLLFLPTSIIVKLAGKDLLSIRLIKKQQSYRVKSTKRNINHFEKPY